jgi:phosphoenolpyruvate carboxykinase (ATP)
VDFSDTSITQNTRGAYPIEYIRNAKIPCIAGHPTDVIFLTCDAFGVLPPVSKLTPEQAMYHFLLGYTARVAGTERGVTEPQSTFSTCFGAPFLPLPPARYAEMLSKKIKEHNVDVWLVNTGWTGGPYGVGSRMRISHTRAMITAALGGHLDRVTYQKHPIFNVDVPTSCPGVPSDVLDPRTTWHDAAAYDTQARKLAEMFVENFKAFEKDVAASVKEAGPRL